MAQAAVIKGRIASAGQSMIDFIDAEPMASISDSMEFLSKKATEHDKLNAEIDEVAARYEKAERRIDRVTRAAAGLPRERIGMIGEPVAAIDDTNTYAVSIWPRDDERMERAVRGALEQELFGEIYANSASFASRLR